MVSPHSKVPRTAPVSASPDHCLTHGYPQMLLVFFTSLHSYRANSADPTGICLLGSSGDQGWNCCYLPRNPSSGLQCCGVLLWSQQPHQVSNVRRKMPTVTLYIYLSRKLQGIFWRHYPTAIAACTQSYGITYSRITSKSIFSPAIFYLPVWFKCFLC